MFSSLPARRKILSPKATLGTIFGQRVDLSSGHVDVVGKNEGDKLGEVEGLDCDVSVSLRDESFFRTPLARKESPLCRGRKGKLAKQTTAITTTKWTRLVFRNNCRWDMIAEDLLGDTGSLFEDFKSTKDYKQRRLRQRNVVVDGNGQEPWITTKRSNVTYFSFVVTHVFFFVFRPEKLSSDDMV